MSNIIKQKQVVEIRVSFLFDRFGQQEEYNRAIEENENELAQKLENQDMLMLIVNVDAKVKMSCGHYEEVFDSLSGCYYDLWNNDLEKLSALEDYQMIENVKDQIIEKVGAENVDFVVKYDTEIGYD